MKVTPRARALNVLNIVLRQGLTMKNSFCVRRCDVDRNIGSLIRTTGVIADELSVADDDGLTAGLASMLGNLANDFSEEAARCNDPALAACLRLQAADLWRVISDSGVVLEDETEQTASA